MGLWALPGMRVVRVGITSHPTFRLDTPEVQSLIDAQWIYGLLRRAQRGELTSSLKTLPDREEITGPKVKIGQLCGMWLCGFVYNRSSDWTDLRRPFRDLWIGC